MAFRFEKLTVKAQEAVQRAQQTAEDFGQQEIKPLHLLKALLDEEQGVVKPLIQKIGANLSQLQKMVDDEISRLPKVSGATMQVGVGQALLKVLQAAQDRADQMQDNFVSTEHLLLAFTTVDDQPKRILELNGIEEDDVLSALQAVRADSVSPTRAPKKNTSHWNSMGKISSNWLGRVKSIR